MKVSLLLFFTAFSTLSALAEFTVVIDPGHGGKSEHHHSDGSQKGDGSSWNNATAAIFGYLEKDLCLNYSKELAWSLYNDERAKKLKIRPILTRKEDKHLSAMTRSAYAVEYGADVFISIHFNASSSHKAEGTRVYYTSADHPDWEYVHFKNPYAERDKAFATRVTKEISTSLQPFGADPTKAKVFGDSRTDGGDLKDGFRILGYARQDSHLYKCVMILVEVEFIDNPKVAEWLLKEEHRNQTRKATAAAITKAICDHLDEVEVKYGTRFFTCSSTATFRSILPAIFDEII